MSEIIKIRNEFYDSLPTGEVNAFDLLKCIKDHLEKLDEFAERIEALDKWVSVDRNTKLKNGVNYFVFNEGNREGYEIEVQIFYNKFSKDVTYYMEIPPLPSPPKS